ncbi:hypothetical protein GGR56DRAFT_305891 [Xylariaceae sp. FL0804]|nr:hypothetical protein GGR56DRAFT_305891 [Xylariaceae sp. FL0804]
MTAQATEPPERQAGHSRRRPYDITTHRRLLTGAAQLGVSYLSSTNQLTKQPTRTLSLAPDQEIPTWIRIRSVRTRPYRSGRTTIRCTCCCLLCSSTRLTALITPWRSRTGTPSPRPSSSNTPGPGPGSKSSSRRQSWRATNGRRVSAGPGPRHVPQTERVNTHCRTQLRTNAAVFTICELGVGSRETGTGETHLLWSASHNHLVSLVQTIQAASVSGPSCETTLEHLLSNYFQLVWLTGYSSVVPCPFLTQIQSTPPGLRLTLLPVCTSVFQQDPTNAAPLIVSALESTLTDSPSVKLPLLTALNAGSCHGRNT